ncbi:hypothetical protein HKX48_007871, partial [Thoreauomyces humboldtii]
FVHLLKAWSRAGHGFSYEDYITLLLKYCIKHRALDGLEHLHSVVPDLLRDCFSGNAKYYREFAYSGWVEGLRFVAERVQVSRLNYLNTKVFLVLLH